MFIKSQSNNRVPSLIKKYIMALTGLVLVLFVLVHMLGNLQIFLGPDAINGYAHFLQTLPVSLLWGFRGVLLLSIIIHVWMAILVTRENKAARPQEYYKVRRVQATLASRTMGISGSILLFFIIFHILHFTLRVIFPEYQAPEYYIVLNGNAVYNVYKMMISGFSKVWISVLYIFCMAFLCLHLSHSVWSMFQTLGYCDSRWRGVLRKISLAYGWIIFLGFICIPIAVLSGYFKVDSTAKRDKEMGNSEKAFALRVNSLN